MMDLYITAESVILDRKILDVMQKKFFVNCLLIPFAKSDLVASLCFVIAYYAFRTTAECVSNRSDYFF